MKTHTQKQFAFLEYINQPVIVFTKQGVIVTANTSFASIVSMPLDKLVGSTVGAVFADAQKIHKITQKLDHTKKVVSVTDVVLQNFEKINVSIVHIDDEHYCLIAEEKFADIEKHYKLLQSILDNIPRQIVVLDKNSAIVLANKVWLQFINTVLGTNFKPAQVTEKNFFDFCNQIECFDHNFQMLLHSAIEKIIHNEAETITLENTIYLAGIPHWFKFVISRYSLNGTSYCVLLFNDITEQKQFQDQIKEQRDTFQKYLDISPYMMVILNEKGTITLANKKACQILGYAYEELIGKGWFDTCVPQDMREDVRNVYFELMKGNIQPVEFYENPVVTKDGSLRLIAWHNTVLNDAHGNIIGTMSSGEDITEQKMMEIELLKSTTNLKAIVKAFPDMYIVADKDGIIQDYQFGEEMKLYATKDQVVGKKYYHIMPEHITELYRNALNEVFTYNKIVGIEYPIDIEGETRWREARLVPMIKDRVMVVIRDVTQRKHMEIALAESEKRYRHLVNRIPAAVVEMNVNGDIVFVNDYFVHLTGYTLDNLKGTHWFRSILHPHEDKRKIRQFVELIQQGDVSNFEIRIINREGHDTHITITTSNVYNAVGKLERIVCIATDITPIVMLRDKLKELAIKDELTGLYNRRGFTMLAEQQMKLSKRSGKGIALFYIDMDNMKTINDTMGHHEGDKALIDVAGILRLSFRDSDIIGRLGGDEFAVLAIDCEKHFMEMMQQRLLDNAEEFNKKGLRMYTISLSVGSIFIGDSSSSLDEVLSLADSLMYKNKMQKKQHRL
ncbi:MAG TPA: PAS domain S-box protein [Spirochaetota bacterium]|nr:PAS domain S-box protein [Spirochaetota bacterium]HOM11032.1 PAS domain S-box protein [Spirochaetota bacterium]HPP50846.1 PAS domain S-box protein [Spirochaetota bacterium]